MSDTNLAEKSPQIEPESTSRRLDPSQVVTSRSPWSMPRSAWIRALKRVWVMSGFHNISLLAAGMAFFVFLSITPLIASLVMLYGLIGDANSVQDQMQAIIGAVPPEVAKLIEEQLMQVVTTSTGVKGFALGLALVLAFYGAMRAASGTIGALNVINEEHETRGFVTLTLRAAGLTLAAILIAAIGLISGGVFAWLQTRAGALLGPGTDLLFKLLTWAAAITLGSAGFALIMRYGPDRRAAKWRWLSPGALFSTLLWMVVSFGFSLYVAYVSDYSATYGSLSAIVVALMWLFLSCYGILLGAMLNVEIERQTGVDTTIGPEMPVGERGAVIADTVDHAIPTAQSLEKRRRRHAERARRRATGEPVDETDEED